MCKFESVDCVVKGAVRAGAACTIYYNHIRCRQKIHSDVKTITESCQCKMYFEQNIKRDVFTICYLELQILQKKDIFEFDPGAKTSICDCGSKVCIVCVVNIFVASFLSLLLLLLLFLYWTLFLKLLFNVIIMLIWQRSEVYWFCHCLSIYCYPSMICVACSIVLTHAFESV